TGLRSIRSGCDAALWRTLAAGCRRHTLRTLLHEDPYTRRGFTKPCGYPGDAGLIDYLYKLAPAPDELARLDATARELFRVATDMPASQSVRRRREFAAHLIDDATRRTSMPHVLSVGCGHLREASLSRAVRAARLGRLV